MFVCVVVLVKVFLMYLLQPMVNYLCKPPRRWCDKCVKRRGEICCEGCVRVTKVTATAAAEQEQKIKNTYCWSEEHDKRQTPFSGSAVTATTVPT